MLITERYLDQVQIWPQRGRHILAQYDDLSIVVYQAYRPAIAHYAVDYQRFGGEFSYSRMSWIKPNFLWMMYRSGWGTKEDQEVVLALRLRRPFFDALLAQAVPSSWEPDLFPSREAWSHVVRGSEVRLQWDPDHDPHGERLLRRALQLGLRGSALKAFGQQALLEVLDLSAFVAEQRARLAVEGAAALHTPQERVYRPANPEVAARLGLAHAPEE